MYSHKTLFKQLTTFRSKLTYAFIITSMIPLLLSVFFTVAIINDYLERDAASTLSSYADLETQQMEARLQQIYNLQDVLSSLFSTSLSRDDIDHKEISSDTLSQFVYLKSNITRLTYVYGVEKVRVYSDNIPFTTGDSVVFFPIEKLDSSLYQKVTTHSSSINKLYATYDPDSSVISFCKTLKDIENEIIAIYFIDIDLNRTVNQLSSTTQNRISFYILNEQEYLYASEPLSFSEIENSHVSNQVHSTNLNYQIKKESDFTDWTYIFTGSKESLRRINVALFRGYFFVFIFTGILCCIAIVIFPNSLSKRINRFSKIIDNIHEGDLGSPVVTEKISALLSPNTVYKDEIDGIIYSFCNLFQKNAQLQHAIQEHLLEIEKSKFTILQEQINPHFLYNSLDTIRISMLMGKKDIASNLIKSLSQFYRISLSKGKDIISIKEELDMISSYLQIEYIGYDEHIHWSVSCSHELESYGIPKFTLQPVVENSIVHNDFSDPDYILSLKIKVSMSCGKIFIYVTDNGPGISKQHIEELNTLLSSEYKTYVDSYGLQNCCQRIRLHYGPAFGIQLMNVDSGCCVCIVVPAVIPS